MSPDKKKRLVFVINRTQFFLSHRLPIAMAAAQAGYDVHVAVADGPDTPILKATGLSVHTIPLTRSAMSPRGELKTIQSLKSLYETVRPDIVHHVTIKPVLYGTLAARLAGVPAVVNAISGLGFVFTANGAKAALRRGLVSQAYRSILRHHNQRVIFQNQDDYAVFRKAGIVRPHDAFFIKGSGTDLDLFTPRPEPEGPVTIILPARLLRDKGVNEFAAAAHILKARHPSLRMVLVGESDFGNPTAVAEAQLQDWQQSGDLEWWGYQTDMPAVLAQAHVVCLPSYREGLPKSLIDAAASGHPIVTTDVPGCRDVVTHGDNGLLVPVRDAVALADALETLILDRDLRIRMGARGRARAEAEFSLDSVIDKHLTLYDELLSR
ncbi:glycosyltransferase family 4 protein [Govanella unica]|uniref:Glycosyltransferase family 4 protein n=1 Tax=Govanella unica TaxID=2975056 RepID=A0A9X3Z5X8_9PROT|nr:glycosyltransferase family 4 protein [Govania unica]MDA5192497.1 glycosyltransferase family 4 protein [Govania unica]